jgi:choice-of-anchor C domain-containing protein
MKLATLIAASAVAASLVLAPCAAGAAELLTNGSFEDFGAATPDPGWMGYTYYNGGGVALPGWNVVSGSVDVIWTGSPWGPAYDGTNSLDINGWNAGTISQSFATDIGKLYTVSFAYSRNPAGAPNPATADVSVGSNIFHVSAANDGSFGSQYNMAWKTGSFSFVGAGQDTIRLAATVEGNGGVFFDKVSVSGAVPEPASWALMIGGFGVAGAMLRRRPSLAAA